MSGRSASHVLMPAKSTPFEGYQQVLTGGDAQAAKRARTSRPKVKSGCLTCKIRRVKCDETKPQCGRCAKFGRICQGYPGSSSGRGVTIIPIQPRIPTVSIYTPSVSIYSSDDESRYFQTFVDHSAKELPGFFDPTYWSRLVLQESHLVPPIRHAVIAIGALSKSLESAPGPGLKVNVIQSINKKHHEAAVIEYLKAIQALNIYLKESERPQLRVALIACLLFICFETFQGSFASSVQQTYGGLKILRSYYQGYYQGKPSSKPRMPPLGLGQSSYMEVASGKNSTAPQNRLGRDSISKGGNISMDLDEFVNPDGKSKTHSENQDFVYNPTQEHRIHPPAMTGTDFIKEQRRTILALPARKRPLYASEIIDGGIRETPQSSPIHNNIRKQLATSDSTVTTGLSISSTQKFSTFSDSSAGPQAPSSSYTPASQELQPHLLKPQAAPTQAPSTSTTRKRPLNPTTPPLRNDFAIEEILIQTFVRLDGQGLFFGMTPGIQPLIWDIHKTWHLPIPSSFPTFASAQRCWDFLQDRALQFFRRATCNRIYSPGSYDLPGEIADEYADYLEQLDAFAKAFQHILNSAISPDGVTILSPAAVLLSLYHKITVITLAAIRSESEMVYDAFLSDFKYITRTSALLISQPNHTNPRFTFEPGIVPPLHVVAGKCRDPLVRREAVELLFASPRQEGMWDAILSARIGRWIMGCEEDGLDIPSVYSAARGSVSSSPQSSVSQSSSPTSSSKGNTGRARNPSPMEDGPNPGGYEEGKRISETVNEVVGTVSSPGAESTTSRRKKNVAISKGTEAVRKGWVIPEENRVRLVVVDFHIPERYIMVKCRKVVPGADGTREERETVIAW